jgi:hypothetical protein
MRSGDFLEFELSRLREMRLDDLLGLMKELGLPTDRISERSQALTKIIDHAV